MNREQAALYSKIEAQFPGALKTLLPFVPEENYKFIKVFGEGKRIEFNFGHWEARDDISFTASQEYYRIAPQKRYCNGVELDECLQPWDELPDVVFIPRPDLDSETAYERYRYASLDYYYLEWAISNQMVYTSCESAIKHAEAMRIVEVRND